MNAELRSLVTQNFFLCEAIVESPVIESPVSKTIPLTTGLRIES